MANFELPFPLGGLNDNIAQSKQPSGTTGEAVNVRGQDPVTGRIRGAQRSGLTKFTVDTMDARIKRFEKVVYDNRQLRYVPLSADNLKLMWDETNGSSQPSTYAVVDNKENVYVIDSGRSVQKWNKNGVLIYTLTPAITDNNLHLRGLAVDGFGYLWVATGHKNPLSLTTASSALANTQSLGKSKIWCYKETETGTSPSLEYSFSPNLTIEQLTLKNGLLYACANDPLLENGYGVAYSDIYTTGLEEAYRRQLPYPACDIDVNENGNVAFASPRSLKRSQRDSDLYPDFRKSFVSWTPAEIPSDKLWSWYDAGDYSYLTENSRIDAWLDKSGNGRDLAHTLLENGPQFKKTAFGGKPCFYFDGAAQLYTQGNHPTSAASTSASASAYPNYENAKWAIHIVFRPKVATEDNPIVNGMYLFGVDTTSTEKHDINVTIHKAQDLRVASTNNVSSDKVCVFASPDCSPSWAFLEQLPNGYIHYHTVNYQPQPSLTQSGARTSMVGAGKYRLPAMATLDSSNKASILTLIYSGKDETAPCCFRFNGKPIDRWVGMSLTAEAGFYLGRPSNASGLSVQSSTSTNWFQGEIAEIITVHNIDQTYVPPYPRTLGLASKTSTHTFSVSQINEGYPATTISPTVYQTAFDIGSPYTASNTFVSDAAGWFALRTGNAPDAALRFQRGDVAQSPNGVIVPLVSQDTVVNRQNLANSFPANGVLLGNLTNIGVNTGTWTVNPVALYSAAAPYVFNTDTLCEKIEGYLAWKYGIQQLLPSGAYVAPILGMEQTYNPGNFAHSYNFANGPVISEDATSSYVLRLDSVSPYTGVLNSIDGETKWISTAGGVQTKFYKNSVFVLADVTSSGPLANRLSLELDGAGNPTQQWSSTSKVERLAPTNFDQNECMPKLSLDSFGNAYYPWYADYNGDYVEPTLPLKNGFTVYGYESTEFNPTITLVPILSKESDSLVNQAAPEKISPAYRIGNQPTDDFPATPDPLDVNTYPRAENVYLLKDAVGDETTVERYELVESANAISNPSPRAQVLIAISGGAVKKITSAGVSSPANVASLQPPQLDAGAPYIDSAVLFGKIYLTDGLSYRVYDPRNDIVSEWQATDAGTLPNRCKLLTNWRGRAVLARGADDPHNWHMSEQGNPNGWDTFPPVQTATQAISGNNARAGLCPDLINSLIPYNDDLLLFGCDSSLWMMRGDPMAGGVFDLVSDVTGVAFGRSWAKDPEGTLYFFGSRGGVYMMKPGGIPVSMTQPTIERRLTEVNLSQFYVEMFWNTYDDGLHLLLMPFTDTATQTKHYFWERKAGAWYEDKFHVTKQPSAAVIVDGDAADDRCLLIGTYDASVVKWDKNATSDDGQIVESKVVIGPVAPDDSEFDSRITNLAAVMAKQGAVNYKLYASTTPDERGEPVASGQFVPGRNPIHLVRARGAFVWVELQQANAYTRWSLESMRLDAFPAGRKRNA